MILHRLTLNGISVAFPGEVTIDFDRCPEGLIALVGDNGAGKSTLMAASGPGTLHRIFPRRKQTIAGMVAPGIDLAHSEVEFTHAGHRYRCRVQVDATHGGKTEAWLWKDDAEKPIAGERVGEVDKELADILPSLKVLLASNFSTSSGTGSFFELDKADRKALFIELLGLGQLQQIAEAARKRANALTDQLTVKREVLGSAESQAARAAVLDGEIAARAAELDVLTADQLAADTAQATTAAAHVAAREALATVMAAAAAATADLERLRADAVAHQRDELAAIATLRTLDELLAQADHIRRSAVASAELAEQIERFDAEVRQLNDAQAAVLVSHQALASEHAALRERWAVTNAAKREAAAAAARLAEGSDATVRAAEAAEALPLVRQQLTAAEATLARLEGAAATEQAANASATLLRDERVGVAKRMSAFGAIDLANPMCIVCPLTTDAQQASTRLAQIDAALTALATGTAAAGERDAQRAAVARLRQESEAQATAAAEAAEAAAAQRADRERAATLEATTAELAGVAQQGAEVAARLEAQSAEMGTRQERLAVLNQQRDQTAAERARLAPAADKLPALDAAEQQHASLTETIEAKRSGAEVALAAIAQIVVPDVTAAQETADRAVARLAAAQTVATAAAAALAPVWDAQQRARGERDALGDAKGRVDSLRAAVALLASDAADYALLDRGFGRDGIQALEIASAGPAVTARANDLLNEAWPRFQLRLDTTEPGKKRGVVKEVFDISILDAEAGRVGKWGSDGEQDFLDETLRLAISLFNAERRGGAAVRTLWRDETCGKLSPTTASRYIQMLRRVRQVGGFHHVLYVSHAEAIWSQADTKLLVAGGTVTEIE